MVNVQNAEEISVEDLHFDRENPRLAEYGVSKEASDEEIIKILWDAMDVKELVQSISASGFFRHEVLVATKEKKRLVVIEGNRRLAAVKLLREPQLIRELSSEIPRINKAAKDQLEKLPVVIETREEAWRYLGFKHVNGPAKWSSYAKAKYIADVHKTYRVSLAEIANQIGDRHRTVQRLFRGLMVIEQAEAAGVFDRDDRYRPRFSFSHLYTGLDYDGISKFLELRSADAETEQPVPVKRLGALEEVCLWMFGSKKAGVPPVIESQNPDLRRLDTVLKSREALAALRSNSDLRLAFEISRPPAAVFEEALLTTKRELQRARGLLTTGYDGSTDLLKIAQSIADLADDVFSEMDRQSSGKRRRKRVVED